MKEEKKVTGTLIWYFYICKREVWLMGHELNPYQQDDFLILGRFLSKDTYKKDKKNIRTDNVEFDLLRTGGEHLLVGEIKKSSSYLEATKMQLAFYLKVLQNKGLNAKGIIFIPTEKERLEVELTQELMNDLEKAERNIRLILKEPYPPFPKKTRFCSKCAYKEFCFS